MHRRMDGSPEQFVQSSDVQNSTGGRAEHFLVSNGKKCVDGNLVKRAALCA
jgi:hypothetical protein